MYGATHKSLHRPAMYAHTTVYAQNANGNKRATKTALSHPSPSAPAGERPRVHLLQKVVECAHHNMGRIRLVWARVWTVVAQHLVSVACHTGEAPMVSGVLVLGTFARL